MRRNRSNEAVPSAAGGSPAPKPSQAHAPAQAGFALVVACMGLVVFGYQLAALNGSLEQVVFELGIGGSWKAVALLQGLVRSAYKRACRRLRLEARSCKQHEHG